MKGFPLTHDEVKARVEAIGLVLVDPKNFQFTNGKAFQVQCQNGHIFYMKLTTLRKAMMRKTNGCKQGIFTPRFTK